MDKTTKVTLNGITYVVQLVATQSCGVGINVWAPVDGYGRGGTYTHFGDELYMRVGTDPDPKLYDHLPVGDERSDAVTAAYESRFELAEELIEEVYELPENTGTLADAVKYNCPFMHNGEFRGVAIPAMRYKYRMRSYREALNA